ncbi:uncharacterized protein LOC113798010 isoform X3 [Dermatophagoides pteronyssinus]|uniref:uncharacterized protein LOC113798010 isoform X3 n=1 Tax=Dermatophagoides pteronyssinus TaxID=6956 RepID=UPI003F66FB69
MNSIRYKYPLFTVEQHHQRKQQNRNHHFILILTTICFLCQYHFNNVIVECLPSSSTTTKIITSLPDRQQPQQSSSTSSLANGIKSESIRMNQQQRSKNLPSSIFEIPYFSNDESKVLVVSNGFDDDDDDDENNNNNNNNNVNNINHNFSTNSLLMKHNADINDRKNLIAMMMMNNNNNNNNHHNKNSNLYIEDQRIQPFNFIDYITKSNMFRIPMKSPQKSSKLLYEQPIQSSSSSSSSSDQHLPLIISDDIANREFRQHQKPLNYPIITSNAIHHHNHHQQQQNPLLSSAVNVNGILDSGIDQIRNIIPIRSIQNKRRTSSQGFLRFGRLSWPLKMNPSTRFNNLFNNINGGGGSKRGEETTFLRFGRTPESMLTSFGSQ